MSEELRAKISNIGRKCNGILQRIFDVTVRRSASDLQKFVELFAIKYLYILLSVLILSKNGYFMSDGYHIDFVFWKECIASVVFAAMTWLYLRLKIENYFSRITLMFLYVLYYIPMNCAFAVNNRDTAFFILSNLYFLLLIVVLWGLERFVPRGKKKQLAEPAKNNELLCNKYINLFCFVLCVIYIIHKIDYSGFDFSIELETSGIYDQRGDYQAFFRSISGTFYAYVLTLVRRLVSVVSIYYLISGLLRRNLVAIVTSVLCIWARYALAAGKGTLLLAAIVVLLYLAYRLDILRNIERVFICGMFLLLLLCLAEHLISKNSSLFMLVVRREMYAPAWLNGMYYDFFSENPKVLWTDNVLFLQNILDHVYEISPMELISNAYFKGMMASPNTGMFAEAYMHFGVAGALFYPILVAGAILTFGRIYDNFGLAVQAVIATKVTIQLTNVPLTRTDTVLSVILFPLALWVIPRVAEKCRLDQFLQWIKARLRGSGRTKGTE